VHLVSAYSMCKIWYVALAIKEEHCKQENNGGYLTERLWWLILEEILLVILCEDSREAFIGKCV